MQERIDYLLKLFKGRTHDNSMAQEVVEEQVQEAVPPVSNETQTVVAGDTDDMMDQLEYLLNNTVRHNTVRRNDYSGLFSVGESQNETTVLTADSVEHMNLETVKIKAAELRAKLNHWWTFADVVPTWERYIERALKGEMTEKRNQKVAHVLTHEGGKCIMGESHGGRGWGNCRDCHWLGNSGLELFVKSNDDSSLSIKDRAGFEEYKARYEYHWNKYHFEQGDTNSKAPHF